MTCWGASSRASASANENARLETVATALRSEDAEVTRLSRRQRMNRRPSQLPSTRRPPLGAIVAALVISLAGRCVLAQPEAVAAPLAEHIPADALMYVGWAGSDRASALAEGSHTAALLEAENLVEA